MNIRERKRSVSNFFNQGFITPDFSGNLSEDGDRVDMAPFCREFGGPDNDRLMQQDFSDSSLSTRMRGDCGF